MEPHEIERLVVRLVGESSSYGKMMGDASRTAQQTANSVQVSSQRVEAFGLRLRGFGSEAAASLLPLLGIGSALGSVFRGVTLAAEAEKNTIAFGTMLKSAEAGIEMVKKLQDFAASTPLNTRDVQQSAKTLLQFGTAGSEIIPIMRMLGDVTGGDAQRFAQMSLAFGQMSSANRLMGQDLLQMINAGWNPLNEISRNTGKTVAQLKTDMEAGAISVQMVRDALVSATSAGGNFAGLMEKQSRSISGLFSTMQDDIDSFLRVIGRDVVELFRLKEAMQAVSSVAQGITEWFAGVSKEAKAVLVVVSALTVAALVLGPALNVLALLGGFFAPFIGILTSVGSFLLGLPALLAGIPALIAAIPAALAAIPALIGPIIATVAPLIVGFAAVAVIVGTVSVAIYNWMQSVGGFEKAWELVQQKALEAWAWLKPIRQAIVSLFNTILDISTQVFAAIGSFVAGIWSDIVGDTQVNWGEVQSIITDSILAAEFFLLNFGQVAEVVWAGMKVAFIVAADTIHHFFTQQLPVLAKWFADNFLTLHDAIGRSMGTILENGKIRFVNWFEWLKGAVPAAFDVFKIVLGNVFSNIKNLFDNIKGLIKGTVKLENIWKPLTDGVEAQFQELDINKGTKPVLDDLKNIFKTLPKLPEREMGELEIRWRAEFDALEDKLGLDWATWRQMKLEEFAKDMALAKQAGEREGLGFAEAMNAGKAKGEKKQDAVDFFGAEARARIAEYREMIPKQTGSLAEPKPKTDGLLAEIRDILLQQQRRPGIRLDGANLD